MQEAADYLKKHGQSQLDLTHTLCSLGLSCCERATETWGQTVRTLLAQADTNSEALLRGEGTGFATAAGRIVIAHWTSMLSCGVEFQRMALLAALARK